MRKTDTRINYIALIAIVIIAMIIHSARAYASGDVCQMGNKSYYLETTRISQSESTIRLVKKADDVTRYVGGFDQLTGRKVVAKATKNTYSLIFLKHKALIGIQTDKVKDVRKALSRWEFVRIIKNLYGDRVNPEAAWISGNLLTQEAACAILSDASKQLGHRVSWKGGSPKATVGLESACMLLGAMMTADKNLRPSNW